MREVLPFLHSDTAKAREQAEAKKLQELKGKGPTKGTPKGSSKQAQAQGVGKLPSYFVATPSYMTSKKLQLKRKRGMS